MYKKAEAKHNMLPYCQRGVFQVMMRQSNYLETATLSPCLKPKYPLKPPRPELCSCEDSCEIPLYI